MEDGCCSEQGYRLTANKLGNKWEMQCGFDENSSACRDVCEGKLLAICIRETSHLSKNELQNTLCLSAGDCTGIAR